METRDLIISGLFLGVAGLTFLRLLALERESSILQAEAAAREQQAREELRRRRELAMAEAIPVVSDVEIV